MTRTVVSPMPLSGENPRVLRRPPALGEHNDEILGALRAELTAMTGTDK